MAINKTILRPKRGYVEVEVDGVRRYRNSVTGLLLEDEPREKEAEDTAALLIDHEYRLTLLELGLGGGDADAV